MKALDLFCGIGGVAKGLERAGFSTIVGWDNNPKCSDFYPYEFHHGDVMGLSLDYIESFDFVWASPPCQLWATASNQWNHSDLLSPIQLKASLTSVPWCIENIPTSPVRRDVQLCGGMFNRRIIRHRDFELHRWACPQPDHWPHRKDYVTVIGGARRQWYNIIDRLGTWDDWIEAMGIDWIPFEMCRFVSQAIPPDYSCYLASHFLGTNHDPIFSVLGNTELHAETTTA